MAVSLSLAAAVIALSLGEVSGGNYVQCPDEYNFCAANGGQCLVMSTSPSPYLTSSPTTTTTTTTTSLSTNSLSSSTSSSSSSSEEEYPRDMFNMSAKSTMTWFDAHNYCHRKFGSGLFDPTKDPVKISLAEDYVEYVLKHIGGIDASDGGVWTGVVDAEGNCQMMRLSDLRFSSVSCTSHYSALCQLPSSITNENEDDGDDESKVISARSPSSASPRDDETSAQGSRYMYSCRCPNGYGYENCTEVTNAYPDGDERNTNDGFTYCQMGAVSVEITAILPGSVLFIDHASYGRPLLGEGLDIARNYCPDDGFAVDEEDYCVASNTLAAVMYWCQGKTSCSFDTDYLLDIGTLKNFFLIYQGRNRPILS